MTAPTPLIIWLELAAMLAVEISLIAAAGALLERFIRSAAWRRTLWQACIVASVVLLALELGGFARAVLPGGSSHAARVPSVNANANAFHETIPDTAAPVSFAPLVLDARPAFEPEFTPINQTKPAPTKIPVFPPRPARSPWRELALTLGFTLLWPAGIAAVAVRSLAGRALLLVLSAKCREVTDAELRQRAGRLARRLGLRRAVRVIESPGFVCPVAFGVLRPTVGLPEDFATFFEAPQQEAVLLHELAHLRAGDPAWRLAADLAAGVLWWHPLVWWMRRRLAAACETAADDSSLLLANGPGVLAECLVKLGSQMAGGSRARLPGMAATGFRSGLGRRVERLLHLDGRAWRPPGGARSALARSAAVAGLVLAAIFCTAWAVPAEFNKGENMKTIHYTWKRSMASLALLTALGTHANPDTNLTTAATAAGASFGVSANGGRAPSHPWATNQTTANDTSQTTTAVSSANLADDIKFTVTTPLTYQWVFNQTNNGNGQANPGQPSSVMMLADAAQVRQPVSSPVEGLPGTEPNCRKEPASKAQEYQYKKLQAITLDSVAFEGLPLSEVVRVLSEMAHVNDPEKLGINFLIKSTPPPAGFIDPATGLPVSSENSDPGSITIKLSPPLKHVRMIDVLDAITKVAEKPLTYSVEDYGVVFLELPTKSELVPNHQEELMVNTFKVDTNTFAEGVRSTFGIQQGFPFGIGGVADSQPTQETLHLLLKKLGVNMDSPNKSVYYNKLTGILMVRATPQEIAVIRAAIQTLGGIDYVPPPPGADAQPGTRPRDAQTKPATPGGQPDAQVQPATFSVVANGSAPLTYQWVFNPSNLPAETVTTNPVPPSDTQPQPDKK